MIFGVHPLQTQAVSYIVQRYASMATMFYLLAIVTYIKWRQTRELSWYGLCLVSLVAGMHSKEIVFTAPFVIVLVEFLFYRERERHVFFYLLLVFLTATIIPLERFSHLIFGHEITLNTPLVSEEGVSIERSHYIFTQFRVLLTYLRLFVLPLNQMVEYDYPVYRSFLELPVLGSFVVLLGLLGAGVYLLKSEVKAHEDRPFIRLVGFGIVFFFLAVSVESFLVSLPHVIFEHRMYLPSAGLVMTVSAIMGLSVQRRYLSLKTAFSVVVVLVLVLSGLTIKRNILWRTEISLWQDNVKKAPMRTAPHYHLAVALKKEGRLREALEHLKWASKLSPDYPVIYFQMGEIYERLNLPADAVRAYHMALSYEPSYLPAIIKLGNISYRLGRFQEAIRWYEKALSIDPRNPTVVYNLNLARKILKALEGTKGKSH